MSQRLLLTLFVLRIFVMIVGCGINMYYLPVSDSVIFHNLGIEEYHLLFNHPHEYFTNLYHSYSSEQYARLLDDSRSFWNDLRTNLLVKMLSIFDLFSFKNFLINTLFYNFLVFFGVVALYRVFITISPRAFYPLVFCIFLLPSALFFSSMIHRDGFILLSLSMVIYHLYFMMNAHQYPLRRIGIVLLFLFIIFLLRNFVLISLLPALAAWIVSVRYPKHTLTIFIGVYTFVTVLFFLSGFISPRTNLPQYVSSRQASFIVIGKAGNSTIPINTLEPSFKSFLYNAPQAFGHAVLRPYLSRIARAEYFPFALEVFIIEILFVVFLLFRKKNIPFHPLIAFCIFFSMTMLLVIGYTVPIVGAIVRYRSIYFIFLLIPVLCYTNWEKLRRIIKLQIIICNVFLHKMT